MDINTADQALRTTLLLRSVQIVDSAKSHAVAAVAHAAQYGGLCTVSLRPDTEARRACLENFTGAGETHAFEAAYIGMVLMLAQNFGVDIAEEIEAG